MNRRDFNKLAASAPFMGMVPSAKAELPIVLEAMVWDTVTPLVLAGTQLPNNSDTWRGHPPGSIAITHFTVVPAQTDHKPFPAPLEPLDRSVMQGAHRH